MDCSTPGFPVQYQLLELAQTLVHWVGDAIQPPHPLSSPSPPALNLSQHQGLFQWVSSLHQVAKYWSFSFSISPSSERPGLISFRMDWFDLLAVQGTLKSLLQDHSSKASVIRCSPFFMVQLSHPYLTAGKIIALTRRTLVGKVMSLLFIMLSRVVIARFIFSKHLLNLSHTCPESQAGVHDVRVSVQLCLCFSKSYPDHYFQVCMWWEESVWSDDCRKRALSQSWDVCGRWGVMLGYSCLEGGVSAIDSGKQNRKERRHSLFVKEEQQRSIYRVWVQE